MLFRSRRLIEEERAIHRVASLDRSLLPPFGVSGTSWAAQSDPRRITCTPHMLLALLLPVHPRRLPLWLSLLLLGASVELSASPPTTWVILLGLLLAVMSCVLGFSLGHRSLPMSSGSGMVTPSRQARAQALGTAVRWGCQLGFGGLVLGWPAELLWASSAAAGLLRGALGSLPKAPGSTSGETDALASARRT